MTFYLSYIDFTASELHKWDRDGDGDWVRKSLCGATIRASLCNANNIIFTASRVS